MGCGSSSLKGDAPSGINNDSPQPLRKVRTNFSSVNYEQEGKQRRMTEYAPDEAIRNKSNASAIPPDGIFPSKEASSPDTHLQPYNTNDQGLGPTSPSYPHEADGLRRTNGEADAGGDPTSIAAKESFATNNDPAKNQEPSDSLSPDSDDNKERKKSWLGKKYADYRDHVDGRNVKFTDEELLKYTGMDNAQMQKFAATTEGVGGRQAASTGKPDAFAMGRGMGLGSASGGGA